MLATECTQSSFEFAAVWSRSAAARFDGGKITSNAGGLLSQQVDKRIRLLSRLSDCFLDGRDQRRVRHGVREMLAQRIYGLALGYEDLNDQEQLRGDPIFMLLAGSAEPDKALAGKSTLNRLELGRELDPEDRYKKVHCDAAGIDELLVKIFLEAHRAPPQQMVIDLDATICRCMAIRSSVSFTAFTTTTVTCRCTLCAASICSECACGPISMPARAHSTRSNVS